MVSIHAKLPFFVKIQQILVDSNLERSIKIVDLEIRQVDA